MIANSCGTVVVGCGGSDGGRVGVVVAVVEML